MPLIEVSCQHVPALNYRKTSSENLRLQGRTARDGHKQVNNHSMSRINHQVKRAHRSSVHAHAYASHKCASYEMSLACVHSKKSVFVSAHVCACVFVRARGGVRSTWSARTADSCCSWKGRSAAIRSFSNRACGLTSSNLYTCASVRKLVLY